MNKVYVTQEMSFDYTDAEKYGQVEFLTRDDLHNVKGSLHNERLMSDLRHKVRRIEEDDYILITGSPYVNSAVFMLLGARGVKKVRILRWDNRNRKYIPLYLEVPTTMKE